CSLPAAPPARPGRGRPAPWPRSRPVHGTRKLPGRHGMCYECLQRRLRPVREGHVNEMNSASEPTDSARPGDPAERLLRLLAELSETPAPSGHEQRLARRVASELEEHSDEVRTDTLGNVIAKRAGSGSDTPPRLMIAAHMDEIGLIVTKVEDEGF